MYGRMSYKKNIRTHRMKVDNSDYPRFALWIKKILRTPEITRSYQPKGACNSTRISRREWTHQEEDLSDNSSDYRIFSE